MAERRRGAAARAASPPGTRRPPCSARTTTRSTIALWSRRCAAPSSPPAGSSTSTRRSTAIDTAGGRVTGRPRRRRGAMPPTASCSRRAPGRRRWRAFRRRRDRRCGRSRARCWRCAWTPDAPLLRHVLWTPTVYLVPRRDGRLIVGATVEERGFDASLTAGGVLSLLEGAWRAMPGIEELPIDEMWVGLPPGLARRRAGAGAERRRRPGAGDRASSQRHPADAGDGATR